LLSPIVAGVLPFGLNTRVAALIMREDRWEAGSELMQAVNPHGWDRFIADTQLSSRMRKNPEAARDFPLAGSLLL
jgi:hypothetical protein